MKQITPLLHTWSQYQPAERLDQNGYFVQRAAREPGALIDPVALHPGDREQLDELGGIGAIVLTGDDADRAPEAARFQREFGCPVHAPAVVVAALARYDMTDVRGYAAGDTLPGGLTAESLASVREAPTPYAVLFHRGARAWLTGALVVGSPAGELSLPASLEGEAERARAARALRRLLAAVFDRVLVARGAPVLREGTAAVQDLVYGHDPEACVVRQAEVRYAPTHQQGAPGYGRQGAEYAQLLGLETLDFDLQEVQPGLRSTAVHRHDGDEECFIILSGEGEVHILRRGETELRRIRISAGDVVAFPPRYQIAHSFKCTGTEPLRFFAFAAPGEESVGIVDYPLSGKRLTYAWPPGKLYRYFLPERRDVPYFENEPEG